MPSYAVQSAPSGMVRWVWVERRGEALEVTSYEPPAEVMVGDGAEAVGALRRAWGDGGVCPVCGVRAVCDDTGHPITLERMVGGRRRQQGVWVCAVCAGAGLAGCTHCGVAWVAGDEGHADTVDGDGNEVCWRCADNVVWCGCGDTWGFGCAECDCEAEEEEEGCGRLGARRHGQPTAMLPTARLIGAELECIGPRFGRAQTPDGCEYHEDGSVYCSGGCDGGCNHNGAEFVTVPASGDRFEALIRGACADLLRAGGRVNGRCGLHLHFDLTDSTETKRRRVWRAWRAVEGVMMLCVGQSRRSNHFCQPVGAYTSHDRYQALNLQSAYRRHQTVEVRLHHGTLNADRIIKWAALCLRVVEATEVQTRALEVVRGDTLRQQVLTMWRTLRLPYALRRDMVARLKRYSGVRKVQSVVGVRSGRVAA